MGGGIIIAAGDGTFIVAGGGSMTERISFLGFELDLVEQTARLTQEHAQSVLNCLNMFKSRTAVPLKQFQRLLGHMAAAATVTPLGCFI